MLAAGDMQDFVERYKRMLDPEFFSFYHEQAQKNAAWLADVAPDLCAAVASSDARR